MSDTLEHIPAIIDSQPLTVDLSEQALFHEARQRRHRRWAFGTAVLVVLAAIAAGVGIGVGDGPPTLPTSAQSFARIVSTQTRAAGTASLSFTSRDQTEGGCIPNTNVPVVSGHGDIDFAAPAASVSMARQGCKNLSPPNRPWQEIEVGGQTYQTFPGHGQPRSRAMRWFRESGRPDASLTAVLVSPHVLAVLNGLDGKVKKVGPSVVNGVPTTQYEGQMTLARLYRSVSEFFSPPLQPPAAGSLIPAANAIRIKMTMWVDSADQVVRIRAVEPLYTAFYANGGGDVQGASQAASITLGRPVRTLLQRNRLTVTVDLGQFGNPVKISAPSPKTVAPIGH